MWACLENHPHPIFLRVPNLSFRTFLKVHPLYGISCLLPDRYSHCLPVDACQHSGHCALIIYIPLIPSLDCDTILSHEN
jgi:hypothetical protein